MPTGLLSESQIEHWRQLYREFTADEQQVTNYRALDERHILVRQEMIEFLQRYLAEKLLAEADSIMRWASHPSVIEKLADKVGDVGS